MKRKIYRLHYRFKELNLDLDTLIKKLVDLNYIKLVGDDRYEEVRKIDRDQLLKELSE